MDRLTRMLTAQLELQRRYNTDPTTKTGPERTAWFMHMIVATEDELHEALNETGWKAWTTTDYFDEEKAFAELRDAWQFLTNAMFTAFQGTPEELAEKLEESLYAKLKINVQRQDVGYDGVSSKCPNCKRALDEIAFTEIRKSDGTLDKVLCACRVSLDLDLVAPFLND